MLDEIRVCNLALISEANMVPSQGLTVLTGETGAGKTALLSALRLLAGERADKSQVREGCEGLEVEGRLLLKAEGEEGERELVVSRSVSADGRSRARLNGRMASAGELAREVASTIDLCGQHEQQTLAKPRAQLHLLDAWAGEAAERALQAYVQAYEERVAAGKELDRIREASAASSAKLEEARFVLNRIDEVNPGITEHDDLVELLGRLEHAEALASASDAAYEALAGEGGALDALNAAIVALEGAGSFDAGLAASAQSLREACYALEDASREALARRDGQEFDAGELAQAQQRLSSIQGLMRAYGPSMKEVLAKREEVFAIVSLADDSQWYLDKAQKAVDEAEAILLSREEELRHVRKDMAPQLATQVTKQMGRLQMGSAELVCKVDALERSAWGPWGGSSVEFWFKPGAEMRERPLARIASGGELSRVMLALKVVLGESDDADTLIFDEVDAGVGGQTANALALVLSDLAQTHQVIVVTHLAQVACMADAHYVVSKSDEALPQTTLRPLEGEQRVFEIARMLSGEATDASLAHAREMLERK